MKNLKTILLIITTVVLASCSKDDSNNSILDKIELSNAKQIINFELNALDRKTINEDEKTIHIIVNNGTDLKTIIPDIEISEGATISPEGPQDFTTPVSYTVTAQDGSLALYIVSMAPTNDQIHALILLFNANPSNTLGWDIDNSDYNNWLGLQVNDDGDIVELILSNKNLAVIPPEIGSLTDLILFDLSNNNISSIPSEMGLLINLFTLILNSNDLTTIPQEVCDLDPNYGVTITTDVGVTCE